MAMIKYEVEYLWPASGWDPIAYPKTLAEAKKFIKNGPNPSKERIKCINIETGVIRYHTITIGNECNDENCHSQWHQK